MIYEYSHERKGVFGFEAPCHFSHVDLDCESSLTFGDKVESICLVRYLVALVEGEPGVPTVGATCVECYTELVWCYRRIFYSRFWIVFVLQTLWFLFRKFFADSDDTIGIHLLKLLHLVYVSLSTIKLLLLNSL